MESSALMELCARKENSKISWDKRCQIPETSGNWLVQASATFFRGVCMCGRACKKIHDLNNWKASVPATIGKQVCPQITEFIFDLL